MDIKRCETLRKKKERLQQVFKPAHIANSQCSERGQVIKLQQIIEDTYLEEEKKLIDEINKK
jgi:hypothetical protein